MEFVKDIRPCFLACLAEIYPEREASNMAYLSIEKILGWNKSDYILGQGSRLSKTQIEQFDTIIKRLVNHEPIQYVFGETEFMGLPIKLNKHTLIPRPETEELVRWVLQEDFTSVLDIGTGSACIAIALAKYTQAKVSALDISKAALDIAKESVRQNKVTVDFVQADILQKPFLEAFELIVSNPPYVLESDKKKMQKNVLNHEPHIALFVKDQDPLLYYRSIACFAQNQLVNNGKLFFEIHEKMGEEVLKMLLAKGFDHIQIKKDFQGKDRMVKAVWKM